MPARVVSVFDHVANSGAIRCRLSTQSDCQSEDGWSEKRSYLISGTSRGLGMVRWGAERIVSYD